MMLTIINPLSNCKNTTY